MPDVFDLRCEPVDLHFTPEGIRCGPIAIEVWKGRDVRGEHIRIHMETIQGRIWFKVYETGELKAYRGPEEIKHSGVSLLPVTVDCDDFD